MQAWYEGGFFTDDLKMKRTNTDAEFITLTDIKRRARGSRIFLSPLADPPMLPPGLGVNSLLQRTGVLDSLRHPAPLAYNRNDTLDTNFGLGSLASSSASPSSSFGGNFGRTSISPDHVALGNRGLNYRYGSDIPHNGRVSASSFSSNGSPAVPPAARHQASEGYQRPDQHSGFGQQPTSPWSATHVNGWNEPIGYAQGNLAQFDSGAPGMQASLAREPSYHSAWGVPVESFGQRNPVNGYYDGLNDSSANRGLAQQNDQAMAAHGTSSLFLTSVTRRSIFERSVTGGRYV